MMEADENWLREIYLEAEQDAIFEMLEKCKCCQCGLKLVYEEINLEFLQNNQHCHSCLIDNEQHNEKLDQLRRC